MGTYFSQFLNFFIPIIEFLESQLQNFFNPLSKDFIPIIRPSCLPLSKFYLLTFRTSWFTLLSIFISLLQLPNIVLGTSFSKNFKLLYRYSWIFKISTTKLIESSFKRFYSQYQNFLYATFKFYILTFRNSWFTLASIFISLLQVLHIVLGTCFSQFFKLLHPYSWISWIQPSKLLQSPCKRFYSHYRNFLSPTFKV